MKLNKKGQIFEQLSGLGIGIAVLAILLTVAFLILAQGKTNSIDLIDATSYPVTTLKSVTNGTTTTFSECIPDVSLVITAMYNDSVTGFLLGSGNYSVSGNKVTLTSTVPQATLKNVSYSCKNPSDAYNSTGVLQNATGTIPNWIPLVVIAVIGAILIGLVARFRQQ